MASNTRVDMTDGQWTFITPIGNLVLTEAVNREYRVNRVLFIDRDKLPRIRKRLGIYQTFAELKKNPLNSDFFDEAKTYAVLRLSGKPKEIKSRCFKIIKDEVAILCLSQLGYSRRRSVGHVNLYGEHTTPKAQYIFINSLNSSEAAGYQLTSSSGDLTLDRMWKDYQEQTFFLQLLKIINTKGMVSTGWRHDLTKAAILIGQSINSTDIAMSFLRNMIALELLLTRQGDKYTEVLPKRAEAFLGWIGFWETDGYQDRIEEVYKKRNAFVHDGNRDNITKRDLLFTDDLLLNLLINITKLYRTFNSKQAIIDFADKVEAEHKLGLKSKVRPRKLMFISLNYSEGDFDEL